MSGALRRRSSECALWWRTIGIGLALPWIGHGAAPSLTSVFPAGAHRGTTVPVELAGKFSGKGLGVWVEGSGVTCTAPDAKGVGTLTVTPDAPLGPRLLRVYNEEGASEPRWISIGVLPEQQEIEPNDEVTAPQKLAGLPVCLNGRLDKSGDVDGYGVQLAAGQTLTAMVEAYALGSPVDMLINVLDERGTRMGTASDGRNLDPVLSFKAPATGVYTIQIAGFTHPPAADVRFTGGGNIIYRLHLSVAAVFDRVFPAAASRSGKTEVEPRGALGLTGKEKIAVDGTILKPEEGIATIEVPGALQPVQVLVTEAAPLIEKEPNNTREQAMAVAVLPATVVGRIEGREDVDRFAVTLKKGARMQAEVWSKRLGRPLDARLEIEGPDGKVVASGDDQGDVADPQATWTAGADGVYRVLVADLFHRGAEGSEYVLVIREPAADYLPTLADGKPLVLQAGKTLSVKAQVKLLNGWKEPLVARASGLPAGVTAPEVEVPAKGGEVELKLSAAASVAAANQPIAIEIAPKSGGAPGKRAAFSLRGDTQRGTSLLDRSNAVWLTVPPAPAPKTETKPKPAEASKKP